MAKAQQTRLVSASLSPAQAKAGIAKVKEVYETYYPGLVFDFKFMDEDYQQLYAAENRVAVLSRYFAGMAILISCLGLFGLAMFTADRRRKEIGIRKVLGSGVFQIISMLTTDFTKIVLLSMVLAIPFSYWLAVRWLGRFTMHIELYWWYFLIPAALVLLIAWLTVGLQTVRAASINPVKSLKED